MEVCGSDCDLCMEEFSPALSEGKKKEVEQLASASEKAALQLNLICKFKIEFCF